MEAHLVRDEGVAGSNPATPTSFPQHSRTRRDSYWDRYRPSGVRLEFGVPA